jgi:hypothetical protein
MLNFWVEFVLFVVVLHTALHHIVIERQNETVPKGGAGGG